MVLKNKERMMIIVEKVLKNPSRMFGIVIFIIGLYQKIYSSSFFEPISIYFIGIGIFTTLTGINLNSPYLKRDTDP